MWSRVVSYRNPFVPRVVSYLFLFLPGGFVPKPVRIKHSDKLHFFAKLYSVTITGIKAPNKIIFVCKEHYIKCLMAELRVGCTSQSSTYTATTLSLDEIIDNHKIGFQSYIKNHTNKRFIARSSKCTTKPLSVLLTSILTDIKSGLQKYHNLCYSRNGINQMWILKNSKELMEILRQFQISFIF